MQSLRACFIGIDRYLDLAVRDLTGAVRDATALNALFCDSVSTVASTVLTNELATRVAIRSALVATLESAGANDTVIVTFAGHGSPSHRLLAHDTFKAEFAKTSISMDELAQMLRESAA